MTADVTVVGRYPYTVRRWLYLFTPIPTIRTGGGIYWPYYLSIWFLFPFYLLLLSLLWYIYIRICMHNILMNQRRPTRSIEHARSYFYVYSSSLPFLSFLQRYSGRTIFYSHYLFLSIRYSLMQILPVMAEVSENLSFHSSDKYRSWEMTHDKQRKGRDIVVPLPCWGMLRVTEPFTFVSSYLLKYKIRPRSLRSHSFAAFFSLLSICFLSGISEPIVLHKACSCINVSDVWGVSDIVFFRPRYLGLTLCISYVRRGYTYLYGG